MLGKHIRVNIDNVWNPVDNYIYGPTQNSIFNQPQKFGDGGNHQKFDKKNSSTKINFMGGNLKTDKITFTGGTTVTVDVIGEKNNVAVSNAATNKSHRKHTENRRLIAELYDNETPRLCDHSLLEDSAKLTRPCSPLESYVSTSKDMVSNTS